MARYALTYKTTNIAARLPDVIVADGYMQHGGFFIFTTGDDLLSSSVIVHRVAASAVLHIERLINEE